MKTLLPKTALDHYEKLREEGSVSGWNRCRGWGVFARNGMLAWSTSQELFANNGTIPSVPAKILPISGHLNQPLIQVLAGIVLPTLKGGSNDV